MPDEFTTTGTDATDRDPGSAGGASPDRRLRVCLVKQHTTYDLYTRTGPDLRSIACSSNWRSGPLGLWEAFECDFRIVYESPDRECQIGETHWAKYVEGWDIWPDGSLAESAETVDWGSYDIVISVDVAIPTRIVVEYPQTMWCYYFIEYGTTSIDGIFRGSPYYGYNVFFDHRPAKTLIERDSPAAVHMRRERRAILDFPYYMMSSATIQNLYGRNDDPPRQGMMMTSHSRQAISCAERRALECLGQLHDSGIGLANVHRDALESRYCVVHPRTRRISGVALVEAISAGCLALAPRELVIGFPELLCEQVEYSDFAGLLRVIERLQEDEALYSRVFKYQSDVVDEYFFRKPKHNLESLFAVFQESEASLRRQVWSERRDRIMSDAVNLGFRLRSRALREVRRVRGADDGEAGKHG